MARKLTQKEWIAGATEKHSGKYTYENTVYVRGKDKVIITCPLHGDFVQQAQAHKNDGDGCKECAKILITGRSVSSDTDAFKLMGNAVHNGFYSYHKSVYADSTTPILITCPVHHDFWQRPSSHLGGSGCKACAAEAAKLANSSNIAEFKVKAAVVHGGHYGYDRAVYSNSSTPLIITCPVHHDFSQSPSSHLSGSGCPKCMTCGYNIGKPGTLYVLTSAATTKVGITNRTPDNRISEIFNKGGPQFSLKSSFYFEDGELARNLERASHKWLGMHYKPVSEVFDGSTECFYNVDLEALINFVTPLATEN